MRIKKLESVLVIPLIALVVSGQHEESQYGAPDFSSTDGEFSGPSAPGEQGHGQGRVVGNSILNFEHGGADGGGGGGYGQGVRQQSGFTPSKDFPTGSSINNHGENNFQREKQNRESKVYRFVSVHIPPPEPPQRKRPNNQPTPKPDTHYQIVFIKAPSQIPESSEISLPAPPQTKTLVYVLMKKTETSDLLKLTQRPTPKPQKPEVFFIRYKQGGQQDKEQQQRQHNNQQQKNGKHQNNGIGSNFGGSFENPESFGDSDFNHEQSEVENHISHSAFNQRGPLPDYQFTPSSQYGISG